MFILELFLTYYGNFARRDASRSLLRALALLTFRHSCSDFWGRVHITYDNA